MNAEVKQELNDFLLDIVETLVAQPDLVQLTSVETQTMIAFELRVPSNDVGKVIGGHGETIKAIRHLLVCAARMRGVRVNLDLISPSPEA